MAEMYFNLVINHRRTCDETNKEIILVPVNYRQAVAELLSARGYDANGNLM